ncbi:MAG: translation elongation factor Ts [Rickettsiales bacterium]|jgi:elongation factor Ts|nr:translation elongation factor Ts [Rickettsiales bacterium]
MVDLVLVRRLRESTGCGVADCSSALANTNGNYDEAIEWLRKKGLSSAAKKSGKITADGLIGIYSDGRVASIVEVNSETDFVARNEKFQELVLDTAKAALKVKNSANYLEEIKNQPCAFGKIADEFADKINVIGENIQLRRGKTLELSGNGVLSFYLHNRVSDNLGKIGVLLALSSNGPVDKLGELGKQLAMHIAASKPEFFRESDVSAERLERERTVFAERAKNSGKPQNIIEKMISSELKKFYEENCLLSQIFVMNNKIKISDLLSDFAKTNNSSVEIQDYVYFVLGDGVEKK